MSEPVLTLPVPVKNGGQTGVMRDAKGRFAAGTRPGPGRTRNPYARKQAGLRVALLAEVQHGDVQRITRKLLELAAAGDLGAMRLFFEWVVGEVPTPVHPDKLDADELAVAQATPSDYAQATAALQAAPAPDAAAGWVAFMAACVEWGEHWAAPVSLILARYAAYCERHGWAALPEAAVADALAAAGAVVTDIGGETWARGVRVSE